jgi:hypothetical protein
MPKINYESVDTHIAPAAQSVKPVPIGNSLRPEEG